MKTITHLALASVALLSGLSIAAAADTLSKSASAHSTAVMAAPMTKDVLTLSSAQQKTAWNDISTQATREKAPAGFAAKVGAEVPSSLAAHPVPVSTANKVPALGSYQYALLDSNKLLIINPRDKKIAEIITQ